MVTNLFVYPHKGVAATKTSTYVRLEISLTEKQGPNRSAMAKNQRTTFQY
jgi:hypothetical protein